MDEEIRSEDMPMPNGLPEMEASPEGAITPSETPSPSEEAPIEDNGLISQYFPGVQVTPENRSSLEQAASKLQEYDALKPRFDKLLEYNRELKAMFESEPEIAQAFIDWRNGEDFMVALAKYVDLNSAIPAEGDPIKPKYDEAGKMRMQKLQEKENRKKQISDNEAQSIEVLRQFKEQNQMSDEDFESFYKVVQEVLSAAYDGSLSVKLLESLMYYMNRDAELENAKTIGEVGARNAKIDDFKAKEDQKLIGDGMPDLGGATNIQEKEPKKRSYASEFLDGVI